ncbi:hypothetical protein JCM10296v2_005898 [Rhodotorula toruloides]
MGIGPELPPHLARPRASPEPASTGSSLPSSSSSVGPAPPPVPAADDDSDDDYGPSLPPELAAERDAGPRNAAGPQLPSAQAGPQLPPHLAARRRASPSPPVGPSRPPGMVGGTAVVMDPYGDFAVYGPASDDEDDSVGPMPLPAGASNDDNDGARLFREREEREKEKERQAKEDKKLQREEWMLVPPKEMDLLSSIDTTKLKSRGFATGKAAQSASSKKSSSDVNLWTETPAERQQRLADEMMGKKRRAENAPVEDETDDARRKRMRDQHLKDEVERYNKSARNQSLLDQHSKSSKSKGKDADDDRAPTAIWDRDRDMGVGGRLMDDHQRANAIKNAKGLGGKFGGGGFL